MNYRSAPQLYIGVKSEVSFMLSAYSNLSKFSLLPVDEQTCMGYITHLSHEKPQLNGTCSEL